MAAPSVAASAGTAITSASSAWTVNLPTVSGSDKGKLMLLWARTGANVTVNAPTGWTRNGEMSNEAGQHQAIMWHRVTGTEGSTLAVTCTGSSKGAVIVLLISGNADPNITAPDNGNTSFTTVANTNPNPDLGNAPAVTCDALFIAFASWPGNATVSSNPTGYTATGYTACGSTASDAAVALAYKQTTAVSADDPGTFTISASKTWTCRTTKVVPGNYADFSQNIGLTQAVAAVTTKFGALAQTIGLTTVLNAQKQWFAQISQNIGLTQSVAAVTTKLASISQNIGMLITATANWQIPFPLGPSITVGAVTTKFAAIAENLGATVVLNALGGGFIHVDMNLGLNVSAGAGRIVNAAVSQVLGIYDHICAWVNPKFLRSLSEDTLALTQEAEDSLTATAASEDALSVVVLAEVTMNLMGESEDTRTLTTETEETTEC